MPPRGTGSNEGIPRLTAGVLCMQMWGAHYQCGVRRYVPGGHHNYRSRASGAGGYSKSRTRAGCRSERQRERALLRPRGRVPLTN